jgi:TfoX/Sxy family transcriptional regulator of competence genes
MAYDEDLADRIRELVASETGVSEQRMFGGLSFLINGNMSVAASGQGGLLVRVEPSRATDLIDGAQVEPMVMGGREMRGWLRVHPDSVRTDDQLERWVTRGVAFARSLPAKSKAR